MKVFWPVGEAAQADYEDLRELALAGEVLRGVAAERFARRGLAGLICSPVAASVFSASIAGVTRPPWTPHADPRLDALAATYEFLLALCPESPAVVRVHR